MGIYSPELKIRHIRKLRIYIGIPLNGGEIVCYFSVLKKGSNAFAENAYYCLSASVSHTFVNANVGKKFN